MIGRLLGQFHQEGGGCGERHGETPGKQPCSENSTDSPQLNLIKEAEKNQGLTMDGRPFSVRDCRQHRENEGGLAPTCRTVEQDWQERGATTLPMDYPFGVPGSCVRQGNIVTKEGRGDLVEARATRLHPVAAATAAYDCTSPRLLKYLAGMNAWFGALDCNCASSSSSLGGSTLFMKSM